MIESPRQAKDPEIKKRKCKDNSKTEKIMAAHYAREAEKKIDAEADYRKTIKEEKKQKIEGMVHAL